MFEYFRFKIWRRFSLNVLGSRRPFLAISGRVPLGRYRMYGSWVAMLNRFSRMARRNVCLFGGFTNNGLLQVRVLSGIFHQCPPAGAGCGFDDR